MQDGTEITISEKLSAHQSIENLQEQLKNAKPKKQQLRGEIQETGTVDQDGVLRRPWCPETRILEHREAVMTHSLHHRNALTGGGTTQECIFEESSRPTDILQRGSAQEICVEFSMEKFQGGP